MKTGRILALCAIWFFTLTCSGFSQSAPAPDYPKQIVKIVVPFSAGSNTDIMARVLADKLGQLWRQTVIVENKPGIAGTVSAANNAPDGYTLMVTSNGHTILNVLNKDLPIDAIKAFSGIAEIGSIPMVLIVPPGSKAANLKELIAAAKEKPGSMNFASAGLASSAFIAEQLFNETAQINTVHIPYKGTPEQLTSVMRGDTQFAMAFVGTALSLIQTNQVRALAVAGPQRLAALPGVPTFAESGLPQYHYDSWFGVMAPANTPLSIRQKISADIASVLKDPDVLKQWDTIGAVPVVSTAEEFDATIRADADRYGKMFKAAGIEAN